MLYGHDHHDERATRMEATNEEKGADRKDHGIHCIVVGRHRCCLSIVKSLKKVVMHQKVTIHLFTFWISTLISIWSLLKIS